MACLNVSALARDVTGLAAPAAGPTTYLYTLRLGLGVVTCVAGDESEGEGALLAGGANGALWALSLLRGKAGEGGGALQGLPVGVEELPDEEAEDA